MFIAVDANPDALQETAWRAGRKPARGGVPNLICIGEPLDAVAAELGAVADRLTVICPWGSLLRGVTAPEIVALRYIRSLCRSGATIEIVLSYDAARDARESGPIGTTVLDEERFHRVATSYAQASLKVTVVQRIDRADLARYETTWSKRLAFGRSREIWRLNAIVTG
jgi:16S rRNA (adenine(1408)-N(1))-methyltransferase